MAQFSTVCQLVEDGKEEGGSLPRPGLGAGHEVSASHDDGEAALLHGSRHLVPGLGDVFLKKCLQPRSQVKYENIPRAEA